MSMRTLKVKKYTPLDHALSIAKIQGACESVALIMKELSHPQRLLILGHLLGGAKTVGDLVDACEVSQPQMSHFLMRMRFAGLVAAEKKGKYQYYSIADARLVELMKTIQAQYCK